MNSSRTASEIDESDCDAAVGSEPPAAAGAVEGELDLCINWPVNLTGLLVRRLSVPSDEDVVVEDDSSSPHSDMLQVRLFGSELETLLASICCDIDDDATADN